MRVAIVRWGLAVTMVAAGAAAVAWSALTGTAAAPLATGADRPVDAAARDPGDITAHNSPTVVRNPRDARNLVITNRVDAPDFSCRVHVSEDGGASWKATRVPIPRGAGRKCYAPDAAFSPDGTLHVSFVTLRGVANTPQALWVSASRDGGRTLAAPRRVTGPLAFQARLAADPARAGRLYATWVQARAVGNLKFTAPGNPVMVCASDDGGRSWTRPTRVNDPRRGRVVAPSLQVGPRGELYVLYLDVGGDRLDYEGAHEGTGGPPYQGRFSLVVGRSLDRGATWAESVVDDGVVPIERFIPFLPSSPSIAVDRASGRLYVAFHDGRDGDPDVRVWSLAPGAARWGAPVRVNDTAARDRSWQYLPQIAVAPGGRVDVLYYDRRRDPRDRFNDVSLQSSFDGGLSFGPHVRLSSRAFDSRIGFGSARGLPTLGGRLGLASDADEAFAAWSDTRAGTVASSKQDIVGVALLAGSDGVDPDTASIVGRLGFALAIGGLAALVLVGLRQRR